MTVVTEVVHGLKILTVVRKSDRGQHFDRGQQNMTVVKKNEGV